MQSKGKLIIVVGPSGAGKGSILNEVHKQAIIPNIVNSVSMTTRKPREGEQEGVHYFFRTESEFKKLIDNKELLEWAQFANNYYGTPKQFVEDELNKGNNIILEIEVQGAKQIQELLPNDSIFIFVSPPSLKVLEERLINRGTESNDVIETRIQVAKYEIDFARDNKEFFDAVIVNKQGKLDDAIKQFHDVYNKLI